MECMTEEQVLAIAAEHDVANCGVTSYVFNPSAGRRGKMELSLFNFVAPLVEAGAAVTTRRDEPVGAK
jgi:hypothetical protein